jgi:hypothetical protein
MRRKLFVYLFVFGLFVTAALSLLVVEDAFHWASGMSLVLGGTLAIVFSRAIAQAQELIGSRLGIQSESGLRPLTFVLWGVGVVIVGLAWLLVR